MLDLNLSDGQMHSYKAMLKDSKIQLNQTQFNIKIQCLQFLCSRQLQCRSSVHSFFQNITPTACKESISPKILHQLLYSYYLFYKI